MLMDAVKIIVRGKVQGVFFRNFVKQNAGRLKLNGYTKNMKDGSLQIVAQGDKNKVEELVRLCKTGPIFAKVDSVEVVNEEIDGGLEHFDIRH